MHALGNLVAPSYLAERLGNSAVPGVERMLSHPHFSTPACLTLALRSTFATGV